MPQELELLQKPKGLELPNQTPPRKRGDSMIMDFLRGAIGGPDLFGEFTERPPMDARTMGELLSVFPMGGVRKIPQAADALSDVLTTGKRVAPKKAALELTKLLEGRSDRVPNVRTPYIWTDEDAARQAIHSRVTSSVRPPKPTQIEVRDGPYLVSMSRTLRRDPLLQQMYQRYARFAKLKSNEGNYRQTKNIAQDPDIIPTDRRNVNKREFSTMGRETKESVQETVAKHGDSSTPIKVMTIQEMRGLVEGPKRALKAGVMSAEEASKLVRAGRKRINDYLATLQQIDKDRQMQQLRKVMPDEFK